MRLRVERERRSESLCFLLCVRLSAPFSSRNMETTTTLFRAVRRKSARRTCGNDIPFLSMRRLHQFGAQFETRVTFLPRGHHISGGVRWTEEAILAASEQFVADAEAAATRLGLLYIRSEDGRLEQRPCPEVVRRKRERARVLLFREIRLSRTR